ncbi:MAG TPA: DUF362 domain-containing protein, partial [bacterium]|nr:DUF362 domain-containing protein [bacterium]
MADVFFASAKVRKLERNATLPAKFLRLLDKLEINNQVEEKTVVIKMHMGTGYGFTTIHPLFVRMLVDYIRQHKGSPFITDIVMPDEKRGYTEQVMGCKFIPATGLRDTDY